MGTNRSFGTVRKLPSGRFQVRYFHLGKRVAADKTFATKADAKAFLACVETDLTRGNYVDPQAGRITFGEYSGWWLEQRPLRSHTRETYDSQLKHLLGAFGSAQLNVISPADVRAWHGRLSRSGLHPNTVSKIYRLLRTILTTAVDDGLLPINPARIRGASKERAVERPLLTWDDVLRLAAAIEPRFEALVWTAAASGLRFGELSGLTLRHVDFDRSELRVSQALYFKKGSGATLGPPKTESAHRTVAVPVVVSQRIAGHIETFISDREPKDLVFTSVKGIHPSSLYPGVESKFLTENRQIVRPLLDAVLSPERVRKEFTELDKRYGFRTRPTYARLRSLGNDIGIPSALTEVELRVDELAQLPLPVATVFVVENRATFNAFPDIADSVVVFGGGYAASVLGGLDWLHECRLVYWGDIDTHGFRILSRLRAVFAHCESMLMDTPTLLANLERIVDEPSPLIEQLDHLTPSEAHLYQALREDRYGSAVRLEQERIPLDILGTELVAQDRADAPHKWTQEMRQVTRSARCYHGAMANIEISSEVLDRIEAEAARRRVTLSEVVTDLAHSLPPVRTETGRARPAFVAAGESGAGISNRIDELLADDFGRS